MRATYSNSIVGNQSTEAMAALVEDGKEGISVIRGLEGTGLDREGKLGVSFGGSKKGEAESVELEKGAVRVYALGLKVPTFDLVTI